MALSSALFSGISGLSSLGNSMQIIGDNIANVNTVGFKASTFTFQDLLSQNVFTRAGTSQVGRGTALADIYSSFEQGSFESTGNTTDLAIGGDGFFALRETNSEALFYSRAGNFRFNKDGYLVNPEGYVLQGWQLDENGDDQGSVGDLVLASFTSPPDESEEVTLITNLDYDATSKTAILSSAWDGTSATPISSTNYEYQSTVKVYDSLGSTHDVTIYYDKVSSSNWEYIITCNPNEDERSGFDGTASAGLLARGLVTFSDSAGTISNMTMSRLTSTTNGTSQAVVDAGTGTYGGTTTVSVNNPQILNTADAPASITLTFDGTNWTGGGGETIIDDTSTRVSIDLGGSSAADITLDLSAAAVATNTIVLTNTRSDDWTIVTTNTDGYFEFTPDFIGGTGTAMAIDFNIGTKDDGSGSFVNDSLTTSQFARASTTTFQSADGYGAGDLNGVDVNVDGVITGIYSNGQVIPLSRVALAKFQSLTGLHKEGGNLYRETRESGDAITNRPGTNGLGNIAPNSLEQSNVDIASEFVKMITTQRGFQANSKIITVTDQMLAELIQLKR